MADTEKISWENVTVALGDLKPWERNPRQIEGEQAARLLESFEIFGQIETIAVGPEWQVYNGHQRLSVLITEFGPDYRLDVRQSSRQLSRKEREQLTVFLHKGTIGNWDWDILANEFEIIELLEWGFTEPELMPFTHGISETAGDNGIICPSCGCEFENKG